MSPKKAKYLISVKSAEISKESKKNDSKFINRNTLRFLITDFISYTIWPNNQELVKNNIHCFGALNGSCSEELKYKIIMDAKTVIRVNLFFG